MNLQDMDKRIRAEFTEGGVARIATQGNEVLRKIRRWPRFGGNGLKLADGTVVGRARDYERIRIEPTEDLEPVVVRIRHAIQEIGDRLARNIREFGGVRDFGSMSLVTAPAWRSAKDWGLPLEKLTLVSLGQAPQVLGYDDILLLRSQPDEGDFVELRVGYYANVVPTDLLTLD